MNEVRLSDFTEADSASQELPLVGGLRAGFPSPAADYAGDRIDLVREMVRNPETTFYARIDGDSMREAGLFSGDIVVIDRSLQPRDGDYVAACVDGEFTLKEYRLDSEHDCAWLVPHNSAYQPIRIAAGQSLLIWGVVTHSVHSVR